MEREKGGREEGRREIERVERERERVGRKRERGAREWRGSEVIERDENGVREKLVRVE